MDDTTTVAVTGTAVHLGPARGDRAKCPSGDDRKDNERVQARGELTGRSLGVRSWSREPWSTSSWEPVDVNGTGLETARAVIDSALAASERWPLVGFGISPTTTGRTAAVIEVDRVIPEIQTSVADQPSGSVKLISFIAAG